MVTSWSSQWNDTRWTKLLTVCSIRRVRNVAKLVAQSRISELSRWHVAIFPTFTIGFSIILAEQPELRAWSFSESILLTDKSVLLSNKHNLFANVSALFADFTELQSNIAELFTELVLFSIVAVVQPDEPEIPGDQSELFCFVFTDQSILADVSILQPHIACILADESQLLAIESKLFSAFAAILIDNTELQPIESELHAENSAVLAVKSELLNAALFAELSIVLAKVCF